eukprot:scaffold1387_cov260-Pinguiococcus_pyrenoidosus.AAC.11
MKQRIARYALLLALRFLGCLSSRSMEQFDCRPASFRRLLLSFLQILRFKLLLLLVRPPPLPQSQASQLRSQRVSCSSDLLHEGKALPKKAQNYRHVAGQRNAANGRQDHQFAGRTTQVPRPVVAIAVVHRQDRAGNGAHEATAANVPHPQHRVLQHVADHEARQGARGSASQQQLLLLRQARRDQQGQLFALLIQLAPAQLRPGDALQLQLILQHRDAALQVRQARAQLLVRPLKSRGLLEAQGERQASVALGLVREPVGLAVHNGYPRLAAGVLGKRLVADLLGRVLRPVPQQGFGVFTGALQGTP